MIKRVVTKALLAALIVMPVHAIEWHCKKERHRSFLFTRPLNQNLTLYQSLWHDYVYEKQGECQTTFQVIGAYQESIATESIQKYFLLNRKSIISVMGDEAPCSGDRDVRAEWLGLPSNFSGTVALVPKQRQIGIVFNVHQHISKFIDIKFFDDYWLDVSIPLVAVQNTLSINQFVGATTESAPISDIIQAMNRADLQYAKMAPVARPHIRCSEINIRFGKAYMSENYFQVVYYSGVSAPLGNKQDARYVFDPVVGNNCHWGFPVGVGFQVAINDCDAPYVACLFLHVENIFQLHNTQRRTLDLKDKPWSRYLLLNHKDGGPEQNVPAASILTRHVKVHPYGMVDAGAGCRIFYQDWYLEAGYNIWAHAQERVELSKSFPAVWGIAGVKDPAHPGFATTASASTIAVRSENDVDSDDNPVFVPIKEGDLHMKSGAALGTLVHKIHASVGWGHKGCQFDGFFCVGAWLEFPQRSGALKVFGTWLKFGGSF